MDTFGAKVIRFTQNFSLPSGLPENVQLLNPFKDNPEIKEITEKFYSTYYGDSQIRKMIIGINPGRLGAGVTGIPFTDSKRLVNVCGIPIDSVITHEPSSVFMYDMIEAYGGVKIFYRDFYIGSVSPLGLIIKNNKGNWVNCNYYDDKDFFYSLYDFIVESLRTQIGFGIDQTVGYVLGKKNAQFFMQINKKEKFFEKIEILEHPRYIAQYKQAETEQYIAKYIRVLTGK